MSTGSKHKLIISLVGMVIFLSHLDSIYINIMEARNFITAREMIVDGNWFLTTMNAEARYEKPPLPTWLTAGSAQIFGLDSLFGLRLPAALVGLLLLLYFYSFQVKIGLSRRQAFHASLILSSSFYIVFMARNGQWDIFTHSFMLVGIYYLWTFLRSEGPGWSSALLSGLFIGCSILSKGPVSPYALLLPFLIAYFILYKTRNLRKKRLPLLFLVLISLLVGGWWFVYVRLEDPVSFLRITTREATRWTNYNVRPFYYYWSFFTQSGLWTILAFVGLLYPYLKNKISNKRHYQLALLWTLGSLVLLSIIPEKKSRYLLPVLIPLAMNTGFYVEYLMQNFSSLRLKESWIVYFNHCLIACLGISFPVAAYFILDLEGYWFWYIISSFSLLTLGILILFYLQKKNYQRIFYLSIAFLCAVMACAFPLHNALLSNPYFKNVSELREKAVKGNFKVFEYDVESPEIIWEFGGPLPKLYGEDEQLPEAPLFGLLIMEKDSSIISVLKQKYEVLERQRYDLNYVHPEKDGYKSRLVRQFYLFRRR